MNQIASTGKKAALGFIFATLFIDIMGFGIIIPVFPKLISTLIHGNISQAASYGSWLTIAYATTQFLFAPLLGNLSDKYGRRPILLCSLLGFAVDYTFCAFAPTIWWLFLGRAIAGFTGASFTTASAYIADISTPETRANNFGIIGVAFGLGFIIGPSIGGFLGNYNYHYPFIAAGVLALLNAGYGYFILPESLSIENRREFDIKRANPFTSLLQLRKYQSVIGLAASLFLIYVAAHAVQSTWSYFTIYKFNWNPSMIGWSLGTVGLVTALVQGLLIRKLLPKLGNERAIWIGLLLYATGLVCFAFATQSWMMFAFLVPYGLGGIAGPAIQGYISGSVPANEQGNLQGALTGLMSVSTIFGPLIMMQTFHYFTAPNPIGLFPGAAFALGSAFMLLSAILAVRSFKRNTN
jgi:DHA1 family tetracycline resistance protein-like MFS transporter